MIAYFFPLPDMVVRGCLWKKNMQKKSEIQFFERKYEQKKCY